MQKIHFSSFCTKQNADATLAVNRNVRRACCRCDFSALRYQAEDSYPEINISRRGMFGLHNRYASAIAGSFGRNDPRRRGRRGRKRGGKLLASFYLSSEIFPCRFNCGKKIAEEEKEGRRWAIGRGRKLQESFIRNRRQANGRRRTESPGDIDKWPEELHPGASTYRAYGNRSLISRSRNSALDLNKLTSAARTGTISGTGYMTCEGGMGRVWPRSGKCPAIWHVRPPINPAQNIDVIRIRFLRPAFRLDDFRVARRRL